MSNKLQVSPRTFSQPTRGGFTQRHTPTEKCWKLPKLQFGEYESDYDYETGKDVPVIDRELIFFIFLIIIFSRDLDYNFI